MLETKFKKAVFNEMLTVFNDLGQDAFYKTHYDLAKETEYSANLWRSFLNEQEVSEYIDSELNIVQGVELRTILRGISAKKGGVATAQLITALSKLDLGAPKKKGPIYIYGYIPVNDKEQHAPNVVVLDKDPFLSEKGGP